VIVACFTFSKHLPERNKENQTPSTRTTDRSPGPGTKYGLPELQTQVLCTIPLYSVTIFYRVSASLAGRFVELNIIHVRQRQEKLQLKVAGPQRSEDKETG
jgi:hypothetical protein